MSRGSHTVMGPWERPSLCGKGIGGLVQATTHASRPQESPDLGIKDTCWPPARVCSGATMSTRPPARCGPRRGAACPTRISVVVLQRYWINFDVLWVMALLVGGVIALIGLIAAPAHH